jgi:hypothetical protein
MRKHREKKRMGWNQSINEQRTRSTKGNTRKMEMAYVLLVEN